MSTFIKYKKRILTVELRMNMQIKNKIRYDTQSKSLKNYFPGTNKIYTSNDYDSNHEQQ